jgi:hypothetical protein
VSTAVGIRVREMDTARQVAGINRRMLIALFGNRQAT